MGKPEKNYSLKKSQKILHAIFSLYKRKRSKLQPLQKKRFENLLSSLQNALQAKDLLLADRLAKAAEQLEKEYLPKTSFDKILDFFRALLFALCVAVVMRQMCFEFYIIPSGSMRPTFKENDYLLVSKTAFGIDTLWRTSHYYFDPKLVKRGSTLIFSGDKMDISNVNTTYFLLFPGKKQYVKRLIGKPGDTLYFYGGMIYGIDKEGNEISDFREPWFQKIEHIPFLRFEGRISFFQSTMNSPYSHFIIYQMGMPVASLSFSHDLAEKELLPYPVEGIKDRSAFKHYYELLGIENFALVRIVSQEKAAVYHPHKDATFYLAFYHHPDLSNVKLQKGSFGSLPVFSTPASLLPLSETHLKRLLDCMTTSRFVVKNQKATSLNGKVHPNSPTLEIPDGTYEFINGTAYSILPLGISFKLPSSHPLYRKDPQQVIVLYNMGIEWDTRFSDNYTPSRFAYFREGDLYLMGTKIFSQAELTSFVEEENEKRALSMEYAPFIDRKAPLKADGSLDKEYVRKYGLFIPPGKYLALGDNHAMSADSREFGFVPEGNIRGRAVLIFWPLSRSGKILQPPLPLFTLSNMVVWGGVILISLTSWILYRRHLNKPLKF
jgi:signal peptidase I